MSNFFTGYVAAGNIAPSRFVVLDSTAGAINRVLQAGTTLTATPVGIAGGYTRLPPALGMDDGLHAIAGEGVVIYKLGSAVPLQIGAAAIAPGSYIKYDATGAAVVCASGDKFYALAPQGGPANARISVELIYGTAP